MESHMVSIQDHESLSAISLEFEDSSLQNMNVFLKNTNGEFHKTVFLHSDFSSLCIFFKDLSEKWNGWSGSKEFLSLEGDFKLNARHDLRAKIILTATLSNESTDGNWKLDMEISFNCGEIDRIYRQISAISEP